MKTSLHGRQQRKHECTRLHLPRCNLHSECYAKLSTPSNALATSRPKLLFSSYSRDRILGAGARAESISGKSCRIQARGQKPLGPQHTITSQYRISVITDALKDISPNGMPKCTKPGLYFSGAQAQTLGPWNHQTAAEAVVESPARKFKKLQAHDFQNSNC